MYFHLRVHFCQKIEARVPERIRDQLLQKVERVLSKTSLLQPQRVVVIVEGISIAVVVAPNNAITAYKETPRAHKLHVNRKPRKRGRKCGKKLQGVGKKLKKKKLR